MTRLRFDKTGDDYLVYCRGEHLGTIHFYLKWKEWVWEQGINIVMGVDCLEEVIKFMKPLEKK